MKGRKKCDKSNQKNKKDKKKKQWCCGTRWFKLNDGNSLPHECRLLYLLECHIFSITLTAMNGGTG